jgi:magnesium-transporting ATPase (P-type)
VFVTLLLVTTSFALFLWEQQRNQNLALARTAAVNTLIVGQIFDLFNCRRLTGSILSRAGLFGNHHALQAAGGLLALQIAFTYLPIGQSLFGTAALDATCWLLMSASGVFVLLAVEIEKWLWRCHHAD